VSPPKVSAVPAGWSCERERQYQRGGRRRLHANAVSGDIQPRQISAKVIEVKAISGNIVLTRGNADVESEHGERDAHLTLGTVSRARFKDGIRRSFRDSRGRRRMRKSRASRWSGDVKLDFAERSGGGF